MKSPLLSSLSVTERFIPIDNSFLLVPAEKTSTACLMLVPMGHDGKHINSISRSEKKMDKEIRGKAATVLVLCDHCVSLNPVTLKKHQFQITTTERAVEEP